jgi:hypothetical protein
VYISPFPSTSARFQDYGIEIDTVQTTGHSSTSVHAEAVACQLHGQAFLTTQLSSMHLQSIGYKTKALAADD